VPEMFRRTLLTASAAPASIACRTGSPRSSPRRRASAPAKPGQRLAGKNGEPVTAHDAKRATVPVAVGPDQDFPTNASGTSRSGVSLRSCRGARSGCGPFDAKLEAYSPIGEQTGCANVELLPAVLERMPALPARRPPPCVQRPALIAAPVHGIRKPAGHNGADHQDGHQSCEAEQSLHLSIVPGLERPVSVSQSQIPGARCCRVFDSSSVSRVSGAERSVSFVGIPSSRRS